MLAEGWWADVFPAPTFREIVSWSLPALPWTIALHVAARFWQRSADAKFRTWIIAGVRAVGELLLALALSPVLIAVLLVTMVVGALPIPRLRTTMLAVQSKLTATVGDSLAFVESPVRAGLIGGRIRACMEWLEDQRCERTVVVAHSQGAAVVLDVLGGFQDRPEPSVRRAPDRLVTFGAGINKLASLKSRGAISRRLGSNPVAWALGAMLVAAAAVAWLVPSVASSGGWAKTGAAALLLLAYCSIPALLMAAVGWLARHFPRKRGLAVQPQQSGQRKEEKKAGLSSFKIGALTTISVALAGVAIYLAERFDYPLGQLGLLVVALVALAGALSKILSTQMKTLTTESVRIPAGLDRWIDFYASSDPVSNGPTRVPPPRTEDAEVRHPAAARTQDGRFEAVPVWNEGSLLSDHTTYWRNRDQFVLRVAGECAAAAGPHLRLELMRPAGAPPADPDRPRFRTGLLRRARALSNLGWLAVLLVAWAKHGDQVPLPFELPTVLGRAEPLVRFSVLAVAVLLAMAVTSTLLRLVWRPWVAHEQQRLLNREEPENAILSPLTQWAMGTLLAVLPGSVFYVLTASRPPEDYPVPTDPLYLLAVVTGGGLVLALIVRLWSWVADAITRRDRGQP